MLMCYVIAALDAETDAHVRTSLDTLQSKLEVERHELHARYLTQQPSLLVLIDRIQDQVVPRFQMARAAAPRTATARAARARTARPKASASAGSSA